MPWTFRVLLGFLIGATFRRTLSGNNNANMVAVLFRKIRFAAEGKSDRGLAGRLMDHAAGYEAINTTCRIRLHSP